jgi:hypothetical protein
MKPIASALAFFSLAAAAFAAPVAPYPPSPMIREIQWKWDTYTNAALGSDL